MKPIYIFSIFLISLSLKSQNTTAPILLDKSVLSGVGLKKITLKDTPNRKFHQKNLFKGEDISVFIVSTESWKNNFKNFWFDEFVYMLNGKATIQSETGNEKIFYSEDYFFAPKGFTGKWNIDSGEHLHYELSVITSKRADSTKKSKNINHVSFDKSELSGTSIQLNKNGFYEKVLANGVELTVKLLGEKPTLKEKITQEKDRLVKLISGQISITDANTTTVFYTGDFFILPKHFSGKWKSEGHGLIKYLVVEKTM